MNPSPERDTRRGAASGHLRWLRAELSALVAARVLDEASAERVRDHYRLDALPPPRDLALLIFGVLGAALFGAGIILLVAHNWEDLDRGFRGAISLALLVVAQCAAGFALWRKASVPPWTEATSIFLTLAIGASISLISQTYNIIGNLGDFTFVWMALAIPVFYLLDARLPAILCVALTPWIPYARGELMHPSLAWGVLAGAMLPFVVRSSRIHARDVRTTLLVWVTAIAIPAGIAGVMDQLGPPGLEEMIPILLVALFAATYVYAMPAEPEAPSFRAPLQTVSIVGVGSLALGAAFTNRWPWDSLDALTSDFSGYATVISLVIALLLLAMSAARARHFVSAQNWRGVAVAAAPVCVMMATLGVAPLGASAMALALTNLLVLVIGLGFLADGIPHTNLRRTNVGLVLLALFFGLRFFDDDFSMLVRGIGMMALGVSFAAVNLWMVSSRRGVETHPETRGVAS